MRSYQVSHLPDPADPPYHTLSVGDHCYSSMGGPHDHDHTQDQEHDSRHTEPSDSMAADAQQYKQPAGSELTIADQLNTHEDDHIYAPPAHLAARLYRNRAIVRRKSSAASSRRNSLSSAQSHASSRSRRASSVGNQSNYVAQHLRRASILESRKARLADRAIHAEQVRLRAALVKAAPRAGSSNSEERAIAAQLAKEKYLAKVAATCAEEVARAKRVAEEVKERKLAEETRARLDMEERHAEAERRRAEYQRNMQARRARRADSSEKKLAVVEEIADGMDEHAMVDDAVHVLDAETAARLIQLAWRVSRRKVTVTDFTKLSITKHTAGLTRFDDMTALVANPNVIAKTTAILTLLGLQDTNDSNAALNTRTFLSSFMISAHPVEVLSNKTGAQEQDLMAKAADLLDRFEAIVEGVARSKAFVADGTALETLSQSYSAYTSAFAAWRLQDSSVLIEGMVATFVELDNIWQTVKDDTRGEVTSDYREGIRDNQVMLLAQIRKLAGADRADVLIKKAIRESRRRRPKRRAAAEVRPRGFETAPVDHINTADVHAMDRSAQVAAELESSEDEAAVESLPQSPADLTRKIFTIMPSNRVLTHELAIDKDFRLSETTMQSAMRDEMYASICQAMKAGFEAGDSKLWTLSAADNIREKLLRMLKPGNSMYTLISETLDLDAIGRQCGAGVFSYDGFFTFMSNVLPKLCAPFRDQEISALCQELLLDSGEDQLTVMINKLFKLLRAVDLLSLDYTNFMVMNAAPTLIREAAGYETRSFAADLDSGRINLRQARQWWRTAFDQLTVEVERRDPEGIRLPEDRPRRDKVYSRAIIDLAISQSALEIAQIPETLTLDVQRLRDVHDNAIRITVIGAVLLTAKNLLKRDVRGQWKAQASRLWTLLTTEPFTTTTASDPSSNPSFEDLTTAQKAFSILETSNNMPPSTKQQLAGTITRFLSQAATPRFTDPVLKVLFQRLRSHVLMRMNASTASERVRAASSASDVLTSCGLGEMTGQVGAMVDTLERVRTVDWAAHGRWYEEIMKEMES